MISVTLEKFIVDYLFWLMAGAVLYNLGKDAIGRYRRKKERKEVLRKMSERQLEIQNKNEGLFKKTRKGDKDYVMCIKCNHDVWSMITVITREGHICPNCYSIKLPK